MAARIGKDGFISLAGSTVAAGYIDSWSLSPEIGTAEITAYGNSSRAYMSTIRGWTVTCAGTLDRSDTGQSAVLQKFESTAASTDFTIRLYDSTSYWSGTVLVTSATINSAVGDKVSVSFNLQGTGNLSYITT